MAVSWGTRKALGRRYGTDPALIMEQDRLEKEYGLIPGREARALQAAQFQQSLAQQQSQFDTQQANQKDAQSQASTAGMVGTAGNLATTAGMMRAMTMKPGEKFFSNPFASTPTSQPVAGSTTYQGSPMMDSVAGGAAGGYAGASMAPVPAMDTLARGGYVAGNYTPGMGYTVNPASIDASAGGLGGLGGAPAMDTMGVAPAAVGGVAGYGAQGGIGTGIGEATAGLGMGTAAAGGVGGYAGSEIMSRTKADEWMAERTGVGGKKDWDVAGGVAGGAAAGAAVTLGNPIGAVVGGIIGGVTAFAKSSCIVYGYFYGNKSREVRTAMIFCAEFMTKAKLLGYYSIGHYLLIPVSTRWKLGHWFVKNVMAKPFLSYMQYKIGHRKETSRWSRAFAAMFLPCCVAYYHLGLPIYYPPGFEKCIEAAEKRQPHVDLAEVQ